MFSAASPSPDPTLAHRVGTTHLRLTDRVGTPLGHTEVEVAQTGHAFGFGCIGFEFVPLAAGEDAEFDSPEGTGLSRAELETLAGQWFDVFNVATLPFYWGGFEPVRGAPRTAALLAAARWFRQRGATVKGHPLVWHTLTAPWLRDLDTAGVERAQRERIRREVSDFAGVIETWDAINEAVIMPVFGKEENGITRLARELGRIGTIRLAFEEARAANPHATLVLNDFDMSTAYDCLLEGVLESGIAIDALGLQSHMHQGYWGEEKTLAILERFSRYGIPIHFTESTLLSGQLMPPGIQDLNDHHVPDWPSTPDGEARQADELARHYRTLLSHPSVEVVTYWGLTDAGAWLGAPSGLVRADGTPKPAYEALRALVKGEWGLAPTRMLTDGDGGLDVRGWFGRYEVVAGGRRASFEVTRGVGEVGVTL